uniref:Protein kinase domain-containing protein n=1 Tax=Percolomonas cosmopolitus TaxID=63605 RepID=A0A7S1PF91_9EUKA|mmetsp:Transcript_10550/g.39247  ORF Transcript_10550/g.39247 Transcript_10550/m.39247 type:complete len:751 (+) Transcript_10550:474-2726(+)
MGSSVSLHAGVPCGSSHTFSEPSKNHNNDNTVNTIHVVHPSTSHISRKPHTIDNASSTTSREASATRLSVHHPNTVGPTSHYSLPSNDVSSPILTPEQHDHTSHTERRRKQSDDSVSSSQNSITVESLVEVDHAMLEEEDHSAMKKKHLSMGDTPLAIQRTQIRGGTPPNASVNTRTKRRSFSLIQSISTLFGGSSHKSNQTVPTSGSNRGADLHSPLVTGECNKGARSHSMRVRSNVDSSTDTISNVSSLRFTEQSSMASSSMRSTASSILSPISQKSARGAVRNRKRSKTLPPLSYFLRTSRNNNNTALSPHSPSSPRSTTISQISDEDLFSLSLETRHVDSAAEGRDEDGNKTINDYTILHTLGSGAYGKVKLCMDARNRAFAIKVMNKSLLGRVRQQGGGNALENVQQEVAILKRLRHPNIVRLFEVIDDPQNDKLFLVMEAIENGPVLKMNDDGTSSDMLTEAKARQYLFDIVHGLDYLHSQGIVHHDIKPENLLVDGNDKVKLTDFGVSQDVSNMQEDDSDDGSHASNDSKPHFTGGTPAFSPPELATPNVPFDGKIADIWSLGVTLFIFVFGHIPFDGSSLIEIYRNIRNQPLEIPNLPAVSNELKDLLSCMLEKDPQKRITISDIKTHSWMLGEFSFEAPNESEINNAASNVSRQDVQNAIREGSLSGADKLVLIISLKSKLARKAREIRSRKSKRSRGRSSALIVSTVNSSEDTDSALSPSLAVQSPSTPPNELSTTVIVQ